MAATGNGLVVAAPDRPGVARLTRPRRQRQGPFQEAPGFGHADGDQRRVEVQRPGPGSPQPLLLQLGQDRVGQKGRGDVPMPGIGSLA